MTDTQMISTDDCEKAISDTYAQAVIDVCFTLRTAINALDPFDSTQPHPGIELLESVSNEVLEDHEAKAKQKPIIFEGPTPSGRL